MIVFWCRSASRTSDGKSDTSVSTLANSGIWVIGTIQSPYFLDDHTRGFRGDGGHTVEDVAFTMTVPRNVTGPMPVMIFGHGIMTERRFRHLPVLDEGRELVGIVSIGDVVKFQSQEQGVQIKFLTEFISG